MNNAVFGKSLENVRNRRNVDLVTEKLKVEKLIAQPRFSSLRILNGESILIERANKEVYLNKPMYVGFSILELSKLIMAEFHYDVMLPQYGFKNLRLLFTDTDSLCYQVFTKDLYKDMHKLRHHFDTSDYPTNHFLYSHENAKVLGKLKDECDGQAQLEFVGLRA